MSKFIKLNTVVPKMRMKYDIDRSPEIIVNIDTISVINTDSSTIHLNSSRREYDGSGSIRYTLTEESMKLLLSTIDCPNL